MIRDFLIKLLTRNEPIIEEDEGNTGFFSTHTENYKVPRDKRAQKALAHTFQRSAKDFLVVDAAATNLGKIATDSADNTGTVAMDAAPVVPYYGNQSWGGVPDNMLGWYGAQGFIGYQIMAMIAQHWLVGKACSIPGRDAVRNGYDITVNDGTEVKAEVLDAVREMDKRMKLVDSLEEFAKFSRVFGIRIAMFDVISSDPEYYAKPFNIDGVTAGSYRGIIQVDPYWISPLLDLEAVSNPASLNFYEPTWWQINGRRIHRSHLIISRGDEVADTLKPSYLYGGISVPQKIYERVYASERTANEAPMLAMTKRLNVQKIDVTKAMANQKGFEDKIKLQQHYRDNYGQLFIGLEEDASQLDTSLNDLDMVIMTQYQIVAAIANIPATKLLGTTPKGFNSTGDYEEASYHEELESIQTHDLSPLIERHWMLCIKSEIAPKFGIAPFGASVAWSPLDSPTAKELAETNKIKADTDAVLSGAGAIDGADIRARIISDPDSGYNGIPEELPELPPEPEAEALPEEETLDESDVPFDREKGRLGGAYLITTQDYLDEALVDEKIAAQDFAVQVSPEFQLDGRPYRVVLDGHHSFAGAMKQGTEPSFIEQSGDDDKKVHALARGVPTFLRAADSGPGKYFNIVTKDKVWPS